MDEKTQLLVDALRRIEHAPEQRSKPLGLLADALRGADEFARKPFGYNNPAAGYVSDLLGLPTVADTTDKLSRGQPVGGWQAAETALALSPLAGPAVKGVKAVAKVLPKNMPVGLSTEAVGGMDFLNQAHRPMTVDQGAAALHDLSSSFGDDIYGKNALQYFGTGNDLMDRQAIQAFKSAKGNPNAQINVYRAVPLDESQNALSHGDWVSVSKDYAKSHGEGALGGKYRVIEQRVPASSLTTNADSILEQGYYPTK